MADTTTHNYSPSFESRLQAGLREEPNGCIVWTKARSPWGYGRIARGGRKDGISHTHRAAWELAKGPIPDGLYVLHACDNPPCSNVEHLFLGTLEDNTQDMLKKGRHWVPKGEQHRDARLSDEQIQSMRDQAPTVANYAELGRMFGVTKQHARAVCLRLRRT